jgi:CheY-like chemotaxis protein
MTKLTCVSEDNLLNIILVEDDDGDAKAIRRALNRSQIANPVTRVVDGVEALELLRGGNGGPPESYVMLIDLNMPRMNGLELLSELRADPRLRATVAFLLTTSTAAEDKAAAYASNVAGYIQKNRLGTHYADLVHTLDHYRRIVELPDMRMQGWAAD